MPPANQSTAKGVLYVAVAELLIAVSAALIKLLSQSSVPLELAIFYRNFFGLLILSVFVGGHGLQILKTRVIHLHVSRACLGLMAMYCFFYALKHIPLAMAMTLFMTTPFFIPIVAAFWLKESVKASTLVIILLGFAGVVLIMDPRGDFSPIMLVAVAGGLLAAVVKVNLRKMGATEHPVTIVFYFALLSTLISLLPALPRWQIPSLREYTLLLAIGFAASGGQLLLSRGFSYAPASVIGPIGFVSILYSALFGWIFWNETLNQYFLLGACLIIAAGVLLVYFSKKPEIVKPEI